MKLSREMHIQLYKIQNPVGKFPRFRFNRLYSGLLLSGERIVGSNRRALFDGTL